MKKYGNLIEKIASKENLELADLKARRGKTKSWGVVKHDKNRQANLEKLRQDLLNGTYKTSEYKTFTIYEPKERLIAALPYFPDRIGQHAILNVLEPIWVKTFVSCTYACIKGRGIHGAYRGVKKSLEDVEGTKYCLKLDIAKCYASLDHDILKRTIRKKIKDAVLLSVLDEIIDSWKNGVPIGNYLSQFFNNLYFTDFDHYIKEVLKIKHYHRYADDMLFFASTKEELHWLLTKVCEYFLILKVRIKPNYSIFPVENGVDFVGYVFRHDYTLLRSSIRKSINKLLYKYNSHLIPKNSLKKSLSSYYGWLKYCNSKHYLQKIQNTTNLVFKAWIGKQIRLSECKHPVRIIALDKRQKYTLIYCVYNNNSKIIQTCSKNLKENLLKRVSRCAKLD